MIPAEYIEQFGVIKPRLKLSEKIYAAIVNRFNIKMDEDQYKFFREYQERVFDLVENLRCLDVEFIKNFFDYLYPIDAYLSDVIIMCWSLPRIDTCLSRRFYDSKYRENINLYNDKLAAIINHNAIRMFCLDILSKNNYVPVHCIDLIWYYSLETSYELKFISNLFSGYIGILPINSGSEYTILSLNATYILEMGLGSIIFKDDKKPNFRLTLRKMFNDYDIVYKILSESKSKSYYSQLIKINDKVKTYFGSMIEPLSKTQINVLNSLLK